MRVQNRLPIGFCTELRRADKYHQYRIDSGTGTGGDVLPLAFWGAVARLCGIAGLLFHFMREGYSMAKRPLRPCLTPGCNFLTSGSYCSEHQRRRARQQMQERPSPSTVGYDRRWERARLIFLSKNPLCVVCQERGIVSASREVDHIKPHRGDPALFWDETNWQALCKTCHSRKTMREVNVMRAERANAMR